MKIGIIGPAHPLRGGGISTFNERLATVLQEQGHDVTIYSFSLQYPSFLFPGKSQFTDEPAPKHLTIHSIINSINPLSWLSAGNRIKKDKPDLVIVRYWLPFMGPSLGTVLRQVKKNKHTKVVCIADNITPHEKRPGDSAFTKYFMKPVDAFITMSKEVYKDLEVLTTKPKVYSPHPLYDNYGDLLTKEDACQKLGIDTKTNYLLFFGFIRKYKGLDLLLEAIAEQSIKEQNIKLIVAGEFYDDRAGYDELIVKYNLKDQLHLFTDFIPNDEIRYYFSAADLIVQPYRTATQSGITSVAYHFEKPMVVTDVGGLAEVVIDGKTGFVTDSEPKAIAEGINKFFTSGSISNLDQNIKEEKKKYSWDVFITNILKSVSL